MLTPATSTYAPAVLLVEDDRPAREYFRDKLNEETSIGVIVARDLREARSLLESKVQIDAIVADLFFDLDKDDPVHNLHDGLDILKFSASTHPAALQYVNSFWADREGYIEKADKLRLPIKTWFSKQFRMPGDTEAPWAQVERDLIQRRLSQEWADPEEGSSDFSELKATEAIRRKIPVIKRTYIQELIDTRFTVIKPIEVMSWRNEDAFVHASAIKLGLLTDGVGESVQEALASLMELIEQHVLDLQEVQDSSEDYSAFVKARLSEYVVSSEVDR